VTRAESELFQSQATYAVSQFLVVHGIRDQHLWEFPLLRPLDGKRSLSSTSTAVKNQTFDAGVTKI